MAFLFHIKQNIRALLGGIHLNFYQYFKTPLEQWIEDRYQENGIFRPSDLTIEKVSRIFNTEVIYYEHTSFSDNEERIIFLNKYEEENLLRKFFSTNFVMS